MTLATFFGLLTKTISRMALSILALVLSTTPSCSSCSKLDWTIDLSGLIVIEPLSAIQYATQLHLAERLVSGEAAEKFRAFGRGTDVVALAGTREAFEAAVQQAEMGLMEKWPRSNMKLRLVSLSALVPFVATDAEAATIWDDLDGREVTDLDSIRQLIDVLHTEFPEQSNDLPDPDNVVLRARTGENGVNSPDASIELIGHIRFEPSTKRPEGDFKYEADMIRAGWKSDPPKVTHRLVYEVLPDEDRRKTVFEEPLLAVEIVTLHFEYRDEKWVAVTAARE
jgi:hypothetical protein